MTDRNMPEMLTEVLAFHALALNPIGAWIIEHADEFDLPDIVVRSIRKIREEQRP